MEAQDFRSCNPFSRAHRIPPPPPPPPCCSGVISISRDPDFPSCRLRSDKWAPGSRNFPNFRTPRFKKRYRGVRLGRDSAIPKSLRAPGFRRYNPFPSRIVFGPPIPNMVFRFRALPISDLALLKFYIESMLTGIFGISRFPFLKLRHIPLNRDVAIPQIDEPPPPPLMEHPDLRSYKPPFANRMCAIYLSRRCFDFASSRFATLRLKFYMAHC